MVRKDWLFNLGGRPAIYQPNKDFDSLPEELQYRHVRFEGPGGEKDFTFEREWRIKIDALTLDPKACTIIVPDREWDYRLRQEHTEHDMRLASTTRFGPLTRMTSFDWHILALGDLGASFPINDSAP